MFLYRRLTLDDDADFVLIFPHWYQARKFKYPFSFGTDVNVSKPKLSCNGSIGTKQCLLRLLRTQPHRKYQSIVHNSLLRTYQFVLVPKLPLLAKLLMLFLQERLANEEEERERREKELKDKLREQQEESSNEIILLHKRLAGENNKRLEEIEELNRRYVRTLGFNYLTINCN